MIRPILVFIILIVLVKGLFAQIKLNGHVSNENKKPLSYASIVLLKDSSFLIGSTTNENGDFLINYPFKINQAYTIKLSLLNYRSFIKKFIFPDTGFIKTIVLDINKNELGNITVTNSKQLVTRKSDRFIINVENSFLANGNSGLEVLQKSPGIWVGNDGSIHIRGNQAVTVMINDVVQRMSADDLQEYLKTLKSEDISKIEVISNPPSEYEAQSSGGIIHIILKKTRKDGLNGSLNGQYRQQINKPYLAGGFSLDYKIKNLFLFSNYSINKDIKPIKESSELIYDNSRFFNNNTLDRIDNFLRKQYRLGIGYDISNKQTILLQTAINTVYMKQSFNTATNDKTNNNIIKGLINGNRWRKTSFYSTTFNYFYKLDTIGSTLKIIGDYSTNNKLETSKFIELYSAVTSNSTYRNNAPNTTDAYSLQADYTKILNNKTTLKFGTKYVAIKRDNEIIKEDFIANNWVTNVSASDHFIYNENLLMVYFSAEKNINKTNIKMGLRAEQTDAKGNSITSNQQFTKQYIGFFPSAYITQTLNEAKGNVLFLNYSRRITRPTLSDLNPNRLQFSSNTSVTGNPDLSPQIAHNIELGTTLLNQFTGTIYLTKTSNIITLIANADSNNFINYFSANLNKSTEFGINITAPFKIIKNWSTTNSLELFNTSYTFNTALMHQTTFSLRTVHIINVPQLFDVDAVGNYRSPTQYSNIASQGSFYFDLGFTKKIINRKATIRLYITDIFNSIYEKEITNSSDLYIYFYRKRPTRTASISFNYNFSFGKKFIDKKMDQSSNDVKNRIAN